MTLARRRRLLVLCLPLGVAGLTGLSACAQSTSAEAPTTVATTAPPTTEAPTTLPPTTEAPTTVPVTEAPTTVAAPGSTLPKNVEVVGPAATALVAVGTQNGDETAKIQMRLTQLGFWSGNIADGLYGQATMQAVMAFQKYLGLPASGRVDQATAAYLQSFTERAHGTADSGTLVEVDKAKQLLFIIVDGRTLWTFNTSTGSGIPYTAVNQNDPTKIESGDAVTPNGLWEVTRQREEGWWEGDLGKIYRPKYFHGGVAIHGMTNVPNYPASHGCVRVSVPAMDFIWASNLVPLGTPVWVHE
ncbi:MAG: L,D-transpeptidase family protein [Ilumatobacteraceae bacterium]|nr:murein L,D-transpeptidase [Ilumatobacter sp.]MCO5331197.1 L,D-transpeptidase family protein [Ilumatobacteraceae bacterium]